MEDVSHISGMVHVYMRERQTDIDSLYLRSHFAKRRAQERNLSICELVRRCFSGQICKGVKETG